MERPRATELSAAKINSSAVDGVRTWGEEKPTASHGIKVPSGVETINGVFDGI